jgi:archaeal flagellin FlaB
MGCILEDIIQDRSDTAAIGIGTMIIFIAMILVAGVAATVLIQTMDSLQGQAMRTGQETLTDVSVGLKISQITGKVEASKIAVLSFMITPLLSSSTINLSSTIISLSDTQNKVLFMYNQSCYASAVTAGLFDSINTSDLGSNEFGIVVIRDLDSSCIALAPTINDDDLVVLVINVSKGFSGIPTRTTLSGTIMPEKGISATISCTVPSILSKRIIDL